MAGTSVDGKSTLSQQFVKGIDLFGEEWVKQLLQSVTSRQLQNMNAFVGVIKFPSNQFLDTNNNYHTTTQFQKYMYVGYLDMLLPEQDNSSNTMAYSKLTFNLDGINRTILQISGGSQTDSASAPVKFKDFVLSQFPDSSREFVFNHNAMHYISDIVIEGANFRVADGGTGFTPIASGAGSFTSTMTFEILVSGYKCTYHE